MKPMMSPPPTGTSSSSQPRWLPAGVTRFVLRRWKKKRLVNSPISRSSARETNAASTPMPTARAAMGMTRVVVVKSPSSCERSFINSIVERYFPQRSPSDGKIQLRMLRVGLVGATGIVGQQFIVALQDHPWFQLSQLAASERPAGEAVLDMEVRSTDDLDLSQLDLVFTAIESDEARKLEPRLAEQVPVVST